jgi:hypothetical protein
MSLAVHHRLPLMLESAAGFADALTAARFAFGSGLNQLAPLASLQIQNPHLD